MTRRTLKIAALYTPLLLLLLLAQAARAQSGRTFYIDFSAGSNSNAGTSKTAPWKSHPYMQTGSGCTGGTTGWGGYAHQAGDHFIFKGGVTWPAACFGMTISGSGTSSAVDYYGVDKTWFTGGSFTRPVFDLNFTVPSGNFVVGGTNLSFVTFDNFEIVHQGIAGSTSSVCGGSGGTSFGAQAAFEFPGTSHTVTVENSYMHDWVTTSTGGLNFLQYAAGAIFNATLADGNTISDANGWYGPSHTPITFGGAIRTAAPGDFLEARNNIIHDTMAGMFDVALDHDNELYGISGLGQTVDPCIHSQVIESDNATPNVIYNNLIHDNFHGSTAVGVVIYECAATTIYNNVMYNNNVSGFNGDILIGDAMFCANGGTGGTVSIYNNTVDCSNGVACFETDSKGTLPETVNLKDNIFITNGNPIVLQSAIQTFNNANNRTMPTSEATAHGFVASGKYSPSSPDPLTVGQGVNLTSLCSGNLAELCHDASGTPWFGGSAKSRPTGSTGWDLGAFQFAGGTTGPPSISISSPSPGTVSASVNLTATCTPQGSATVSSIQFTIDGFPFGAAGASSPYTLSWNTATAANANHVIGASCTDSNAQVGTAGAVTVTVSNSNPGCFISRDNDSGALSWTANQSFTAQSANFTATVTVTPNTAHQDSVIALSENAMSAYSQGAALLRFNSSGFIDVYKGTISNYASDNSAPYSAGTAYSFTYTINFTGPNAGTYSVSETSPSSIAIATNYAFRSTALIASLGFINAISDNTTPDTAKVCNFQVGSAASLTFSPLSLDIGNVTVGSNATQNITATTSGGSVNFSSVGISGNADFTINSNTCSGSVPSSCTTQIKFAPTSAALETATVAYTDDATGSPQSVAVSGTGVPATPTLSVDPSSVNFGSVQVLTTSSSGPIVLTISSGPVTFTGTPSFSGANAADFAIASNTCTGTVSAASCQTVVSFTPSLVAAESATLTYTDTATGSPQSVALTGSGYLAPHPPTAAQATVN